MEFSLIIPTYNESANILSLLDRIRRILGQGSYEIIVVDDASPDGTGGKVSHYAQTHPWVRLLTRTGQRGLSGAVMAGWGAAKGKILGVMDADGSHDPAILPVMLEAVRSGKAEMALGSRRVPGGGADLWPWHRRLASDVATLLCRWVLSLSVRDPMTGYAVFDRDVWGRVKTPMQAEGYKIVLELICKGTPRPIVEVPYVFLDRKQGVSKMTLGVMIHYLRMLLSLWRGRRGSQPAPPDR